MESLLRLALLGAVLLQQPAAQLAPIFGQVPAYVTESPWNTPVPPTPVPTTPVPTPAPTRPPAELLIEMLKPTCVATEGEAGILIGVTLNSPAHANVTVPVVSMGEGKPIADTLVFDPTNWNNRQLGSLYLTDNEKVDGNRNFNVTYGPTKSDDPHWNGVEYTMSCSVIDNDKAEIKVNPLELKTNEKGEAVGGTTSNLFFVSITSEPEGDVTVDLSSNDTAEIKLSTESLVFTPMNWKEVKTVTITGQPDRNVSDGDKVVIITTHKAKSSDKNYKDFDAPDVKAINIDLDFDSIKAEPECHLRVAENGKVQNADKLSPKEMPSTFSLKITSRPTAPINISAVSLNEKEGLVTPGFIIVQPDDWQNHFDFQLSPVDDAVADCDQVYDIEWSTSSEDKKYHDKKGTVSAVTEDDEGYCFRVVKRCLNTMEPATPDVSKVYLSKEPTAAVTVTFTSSDTSEVIPAESTVVFTPANWSSIYEFVVKGLDDDYDERTNGPYTITSVMSSTDTNYNGKAGMTMTVTHEDDDNAGISVLAQVMLFEDRNKVNVLEVPIKLTSAPEFDKVKLKLSGVTQDQKPTGWESEVQFSPTEMTFTEHDWNVEQTLTVRSFDDWIDDDNYTMAIKITTETTDAVYSPKEPLMNKLLWVINVDNDTAGIEAVAENPILSEEQLNSTEVTLRLTSEPLADVKLNFTTNEAFLSQQRLSVDSLTFTPGNWNVLQTITVWALDDFYDDHDKITQFIPKPETTDPKYSSVATAVDFTNLDNDTAGVIVVPPSSNVTYEDGHVTLTFGLRLASLPIGCNTDQCLIVGFGSSDKSNGFVVGTPYVLFGMNDWNITKNVTLASIDDFIVDGDQPYNITFAVNTAMVPSEYLNIPVPPLNLINIDDDVAGLKMAHTSNHTTEDGGVTEIHTHLTSQPRDTVTFELSVADDTEGQLPPTQITFTPDNWNQSQVVTVRGVDDFIVDGNQSYTVDVSKGVSSDKDYSDLSVPPLELVNLDNDRVGFTWGSPVVTTTEGTEIVIPLSLTSQPSADVVVSALVSNDSTEGSVKGFTAMTFTPTSWNTPQTVTVVGEEDTDIDGDISYALVGTIDATTQDVLYKALGTFDIPAVNLDNDSPGVSVIPTSGLVTSETGTTTSFVVRTKTSPGSEVTIPIVVKDPTEGKVSVASVVIPGGAKGDQMQVTVNVTGVDDSDWDGPIQYQITVGPSSSTDANYNGIDLPAVTVVNNDNETQPCNLFGGICQDYACTACCDQSCGECGGPQCATKPGGEEKCCPEKITKTGKKCSDTVAAPCFRGTPCEPYGGVCADDKCRVCCSQECGTCGGETCSALPGGASKCCEPEITKAKVPCSQSLSAPCVRVVDQCTEFGGTCDSEKCWNCCDGDCSTNPPTAECGTTKAAPCVRVKNHCKEFGGVCPDEKCATCCPASCGDKCGQTCGKDDPPECCTPETIGSKVVCEAGTPPPCIRTPDACTPYGGTCADAECTTCCSPKCDKCGECTTSECCTTEITKTGKLCEKETAPAPCIRTPDRCYRYGGVCSDETCSSCCPRECGACSCAPGGDPKCCPGSGLPVCTDSTPSPCSNPCARFNGTCSDSKCITCCPDSCTTCGKDKCSADPTSPCCDTTTIETGNMCSPSAPAPCLRVSQKCNKFGGMCDPTDMACKACCSGSCLSCGSDQCLGNPECCPEKITKENKKCEASSSAPCVTETTPCSVFGGICKADGSCDVCCPRSCKVCNAPDCMKYGNASECCMQPIVDSNKKCTAQSTAPCARESLCDQFGGICGGNGCTVCCDPECGDACGTADCASAPGGAAKCCEKRITEGSPRCGKNSTVPCLREPVCEKYGGICKDDDCTVCCGKECGTCSDKEQCKAAPGGEGACCPTTVIHDKPRCSDTQSAPCALVPYCEYYGGICNNDECTVCCDPSCGTCDDQKRCSNATAAEEDMCCKAGVTKKMKTCLEIKAAPCLRAVPGEDDDDGFPWWILIVIILVILCCLLLLLALLRKRKQNKSNGVNDMNKNQKMFTMEEQMGEMTTVLISGEPEKTDEEKKNKLEPTSPTDTQRPRGDSTLNKSTTSIGSGRKTKSPTVPPKRNGGKEKAPASDLDDML